MTMNYVISWFIRALVEPFISIESHTFAQAAFLVRAQFPAHCQPLCWFKIEILVNEPLLLPADRRALIHDYPEPLSAEIQVYQHPEIIAEKLRALLQSQERLKSRGWGASRVCRDYYYDLWSILRRESGGFFIPSASWSSANVPGVN